MSSELATNMDILPTIAEIVGIDVSACPPIDGHSILALMTDPENAKSPTDYFVYYDPSDDDGDGYPDIRAVRDADGWKLQIEDEQGNEVKELYYLPDDISTEHDLSAQHGDKVRELLDAAAAIDADVEAGARPEWTPQAELLPDDRG